MNILSKEKTLQVLEGLVQAQSESAVSRNAGVNARTVSRLALHFGTAARRLHDERIQKLAVLRLCVLEQSIRLNLPGKGGKASLRLYVASDPESTAIISFTIGSNNNGSSFTLVQDAQSRVQKHAEITPGGTVPDVRCVTYAQGKRVEPLMSGVALLFCYHNFCVCVSDSADQQQTPAMRLRIEDHIWTTAEFMSNLGAPRMAAAKPAPKRLEFTANGQQQNPSAPRNRYEQLALIFSTMDEADRRLSTAGISLKERLDAFYLWALKLEQKLKEG